MFGVAAAIVQFMRENEERKKRWAAMPPDARTKSKAEWEKRNENERRLAHELEVARESRSKNWIETLLGI